MNKVVRIILIIIACVCFGVALSYPIKEYFQDKANLEGMDDVYALLEAGRQDAAAVTVAPATEVPETQAPDAEAPDAGEPEPGDETERTEPEQDESDASQTPGPSNEPAAAQETAPSQTDVPAVTATPEPPATPTPEPTPSPTPDRHVNSGVPTWDQVEKVAFDESQILPQYQKLYEQNNDMVGWMSIQDTKISYPVMQTEDETYYLTHDFFHGNNENGLLILDAQCDPYTPSYHLVVSGHNRKNGQMFSDLYSYFNNKQHWSAHKYIQFDSLMEERTYIVFAAFFAADYGEDEEGFRYNTNIQYSVDARLWLAEIDAYRLYDTGVDVAFGDEFLTLTTCNSSRRKNGRFVVVCRRLREGETME